MYAARGTAQPHGDLFLTISFRRQQQNLIRLEITREYILGEERAIVGKDRLCAEHNNAPLGAFVAQRLCRRDCGDSTSDHEEIGLDDRRRRIRYIHVRGAADPRPGSPPKLLVNIQFRPKNSPPILGENERRCQS